MRVLGIETSCDETAVAIYDTELGLLVNEVYSQIALHATYGGVVPELASRDHIRKLAPMVLKALEQAKLKAGDIDGVAYTAGPGLVGALLVGACLGRALAYGWRVPALAVHHMEGHLLAPMLVQPQVQFPFVALLVSGGHSQLIRAQALGDYQLLGDTLDDAAGEAFDKTAKLLDLPYPGGPAISRLAEQGQAGRFQFPRPMVDRPGLDFSFSGLKTYSRNTVQSLKAAGQLDDQARADVALAFQTAVVDTLFIKCKRALKQTGLKKLVIAGGVSANQALQTKLRGLTASLGAEVFFPPPAMCTDNAAMIAYAGCLRLQAGQSEDLPVTTKARWPLADLKPV